MTFDREYFESDNQTIGYRGEGFRDFSAHFAAMDRILSLCPQSVLELGGARGYVAKKLIARGVPTTVLERSEHCYYTRAVDSFVRHDIEKPPYPFQDKQFDLVFSDSVIEHLHYECIDDVIKEITRVSKRSLHGVPLTDSGQTREEFMGDSTHIIFESKTWWTEKFAKADPSHKVELSGNIMGDIGFRPNIPVISIDGQNLVKLNFGSFVNMFYYGWVNIDLNLPGLAEFAGRNGYKFTTSDMRRVPFPFQDGTVDLIFSSHALEHIDRERGLAFLKECYRMLKPGGVIRIAVPDAAMLMWECCDGKLDYLKHFSPAAEKSECSIDKMYEVLLTGHATIYDVCSLAMMFRKAGFADAKVMDPFHSLDAAMEDETIVSHPAISLVMEAKK